MRTVTFAFYVPSSPRDVFGHAVTLLTRSAYSHCAVAVADRSPVVLYEAVGQGIVQHTDRDAERRLAQAAHCLDVYAAEDDLARAIAWADSQVGLSYEWWQCASVWLATITPLPALDGVRICSVFDAEFALRAGVWAGDPLTQTPGSFAHSLGA